MTTDLPVIAPNADRRTWIGSSDIAGILGISPWQTRVQVWERKMGLEEPPKSGKKKLYARGKRWEAAVCEMLVAELEACEHTVRVLKTNERYSHPEYAWAAAEIDMEIQLDDIPDVVNVECKTVSPFAMKHWGESETDEVPLWYAAQGMYGLAVTGRKCCVLAPMFGADELRVYPIVRDEETIAGMLERAREFWENHVLTGIAPEPVNLADIDRLFKRDTDTIIEADAAMLEKLLAYRTAKSAIAYRAAELELLEFQIKNILKDATAVVMSGDNKALCTWKSRKTVHLDQASFKADYPKLWKQYLREGTARVFTVKGVDIA